MFESFKKEIRTDVEEFLAIGKMQRAIELSAQTGQHFNHSRYPMYFVGKLDSRLVLVHLNPKQPNDTSPSYTGSHQYRDFDDYFDYHKHFGRNKFGSGLASKPYAVFDSKQIRFLKPFGVIDFIEEHTREDKFTNLERVIDDKLQLELIPYGSSSFSAKGFTHAILAPHWNRILDVIAACPRDYVVFCGRIFEMLLPPESTIQPHKFNVIKKNGQPVKNQVGFSNVRFDHSGVTISAGLARSFALQGIPMAAYGHKCKELYGRWCS